MADVGCWGWAGGGTGRGNRGQVRGVQRGGARGRIGCVGVWAGWAVCVRRWW